MKNDINVKKRAAVLTVIVVILVAVCVGAIAHMKSSGRDGSLMAYVYRDNEIIDSINLSKVSEAYRITYEYNGGEKNVVEVRPGSIGIVEATCPDHLCMNMGFISDELMPVTCLPNHLVIRVVYEGSNSNAENNSTMDGLAY